jgi:FAD/FMN-containing dehydrogenase
VRYDIAGLQADLGAIPVFADPARIKNKSRDYYWYSPILRERLDAVRADLVVLPRDENETIAALAACHRRNIPVTPRGAGTGNYGQAMPLAGGVVLDLSALDRILFIRRGVLRAQGGARLIDLDQRAQQESGQEQRMHPSTLRHATLGGFICGGSGGVGSVTWGGLRDRGNVLGVRVLTMEAAPRALELRGGDVQKAIHAYGTTGIVTEVEIALAGTEEWIEAIVAFDSFEKATQFGYALACQDAVLKKLVTVLAAPIAAQFIRPVAEHGGFGRHVVLAMIASQAFEPFEALVHEWSGVLAYRGAPAGVHRSDASRAPERPRLPLPVRNSLPLPIYEYAWNHTTLHALKVSRNITYLQTLHPAPASVTTAIAMHHRFGDEVLQHLEFVRFDGNVACFGLPLARFTTAARLAEIESIFENGGCPTFSPHAVTLEEGGMKRVDPVQLAFKREVDQSGLLNPGKMLAWEQPDYDGPATRTHLFPAGRPSMQGG